MLGAIIGDIVGSSYDFDIGTGSGGELPLFNSKSRFTEYTIFICALADAIMSSTNNFITDEVYREVKNSCKESQIKDRNRAVYFPAYDYDPEKGEEFHKNTFFKLLAYGKKYGIIAENEFILVDSNSINLNQLPTNDDYLNKAFNANKVGIDLPGLIVPLSWACDTDADIKSYLTIMAGITNMQEYEIKASLIAAICIRMARMRARKYDIKKRLPSLGIKLPALLSEINTDSEVHKERRGKVSAAISAFLESSSFEEALRNALRKGDSPHCQTTLAGAMAEAYYDQIPKYMVVEARDRLDDSLNNIIDRWQKWLRDKRIRKMRFCCENVFPMHIDIFH